MKRIIRLATIVAMFAVVVFGAGWVAASAAHPTVSIPTRHAYLYITIVNGGMPGAQVGTADAMHKDWPFFSPSAATVPANSLVTVTILNTDDGTSPVAANSPLAKVSGTVDGSMLVNGKSVTSIDPTQMSHTFNVPSFGLSVPIPPQSTVTFTFRTGKAGTFTWLCVAPCGTGATGMDGAMATHDFMVGTLTVQP